jgi:hypothetical protein
VSLKTRREALCAAQAALNERAYSGVDVDRVPVWVDHLGQIISEIDQQMAVSER